MRFIAACLIFLLSPLPGIAHSPYFSTWSCQTAEGNSLRLFYGDGLFGPDPASVVALSPKGHLLAIQPLGDGSFPLPGSECQIADPEAGAVWRADPEDFFAGIQIFGDSEQARGARWQYEPGVVHKSFGFQQTPWPMFHLQRGFSQS
jgi:hypothetical protein